MGTSKTTSKTPVSIRYCLINCFENPAANYHEKKKKKKKKRKSSNNKKKKIQKQCTVQNKYSNLLRVQVFFAFIFIYST